jgi:flagellar biosynthesis/type III secretory pathway chaperone
MLDYGEILDRLNQIHVLLLEERALLEASDIGGLEGYSVRKEAAMRHLMLGDAEAGQMSLAESIRTGELSAEQRAAIERQFASLQQENAINGALISAAVERSNAISALISARVTTAVYGESGRFRGPASGSRLTRTA